MQITSSTATKTSSSERGEYYELGTGKTYAFDITLSNAFDDVSSDLSVTEIGGYGTLYFGNGSFNDGGYINFTEMSQKDIGELADQFITSATLSGNTLTVKTGSKVMESYYSRVVPDEYFIADIYYDRYVIEMNDDWGIKDSSDTFTNEKAQSNAETIGGCYFYVTVKDSISGLSETVRLWLVSSVSGVSFSQNTLRF